MQFIMITGFSEIVLDMDMEENVLRAIYYYI